MKIIYNKVIPFRGFSAIMLFGVIFARREYEPLPERVINHESIHKAQAKENGGYVLYYVKYIYWWIRKGYRNNPFEKEAYQNDNNLLYLTMRDKHAWKKHI